MKDHIDRFFVQKICVGDCLTDELLRQRQLAFAIACLSRLIGCTQQLTPILTPSAAGTRKRHPDNRNLIRFFPVAHECLSHTTPKLQASRESAAPRRKVHSPPLSTFAARAPVVRENPHSQS